MGCVGQIGRTLIFYPDGKGASFRDGLNPRYSRTVGVPRSVASESSSPDRPVAVTPQSLGVKPP